MDNAGHISLSKLVALEHHLNITANNMANVATLGYKNSDLVFQEYIKSNARYHPEEDKDRKISFVVDFAEFNNFSQGNMVKTDGPLDVAITGDGWFSVDSRFGTAYTKAGKFEINNEGVLVDISGNPVQGEGSNIVFSPTDADVTITKDGIIHTNNGIRGKLKVSFFPDQRILKNISENLFTASIEGSPEGDFTINQGYLEESNVKPMVELTRLIDIQKQYTKMSELIKKDHEQRKSAISRLGNKN